MTSTTTLVGARLRRRHGVLPANWALVIAGVSSLLLVVITAQVITGGVLVDLDWRVFRYNFERRYPAYDPLMEHLVALGQRGPTVPVAVAGAVWAARRARDWWPVVLLLGSLLTLNVVVGAAKLSIGRAKGESGSSDAFMGGTMYPSGHSSNTVVLWGVLAYVLVRYGGVRRRRLVWAVAALPTMVVAAASTFIGSHWISDIYAGWLFGLIILVAAVDVDGRVRPVVARRAGRHTVDG